MERRSHASLVLEFITPNAEPSSSTLRIPAIPWPLSSGIGDSSVGTSEFVTQPVGPQIRSTMCTPRHSCELECKVFGNRGMGYEARGRRAALASRLVCSRLNPSTHAQDGKDGKRGRIRRLAGPHGTWKVSLAGGPGNCAWVDRRGQPHWSVHAYEDQDGVHVAQALLKASSGHQCIGLATNRSIEAPKLVQSHLVTGGPSIK